MTTSPPRVGRLPRLGALLLLTVLLGAPPVALIVLGSAYLPTTVPTWDRVTAALSGPDTGAVFLGTLVVVGWLAWAAFALGVAVELPAQLRGLASPRLPTGLGGPQRLAGLLVAAVLGAGPLPALALSTPAHALPAAAVPASGAATGFGARPADAAPHHDPATPAPAPMEPVDAWPGPLYTVQPRDTLGRIAARTLGDWHRFEELLELNRGHPQADGGQLTDAAVLRPGWVLRLPTDATVDPAADPAADHAVVVPGDTLSGIAREHGLPDWHPLFDLNEGEPQPGGRHFTDPDLIFPGQVLTVRPPTTSPAPAAPPSPDPAPSTATAPVPSTPAAPPSEPPPVPAPATPTAPTAAPPSASPATASWPTAPDAPPTPRATSHERSSHASPAVPATLAGLGVLLAGCLSAVLVLLRRQRLRRRSPGRALAPTPPPLRATERAVRTAATAGPDVAVLDRALRALSVAIADQPDGHLPDVLAARLGPTFLELRLAAPAESPPPAPWTGDRAGLRWSLQLAADLGEAGAPARGRLAPYPALVSIGDDGDDRWLLDLERVGVLGLRGPASRRRDFCRHLAAELAINRWSDLLWVTVLGFGAELAELAPTRITVAATERDLPPGLRERLDTRADDSPTDDGLGAVLDGRLRAYAGDGWMPSLLLVPEPTDPALTEVAVDLAQRGRRGAVALVLGEAKDTAGSGWQVELTDDGALLVPALDLRLRAPQLSQQDASDITALVAFEREADDVAPRGGDLGDSRAAADTGPPAHPAPDNDHHAETSAVGASTPPDDRGARRPRARETSPDKPLPSSAISPDEDPLAQALAEWWDETSPRPKVTLLGPVRLRAPNEHVINRSGLHRRCEEAVAYLATRPNGASVDEAAQVLRPDQADPISARASIHHVMSKTRAWLGIDPLTGKTYLRPAKRGAYQLKGVLIDANLFDALRTRAARRGRAGREDLLAALRLVSGPPFGQRPSGYEWLNGLDLAYTAAICDVAHHVVSGALADGDLNAARAASATAVSIASDDETVLLDAMWVAFRSGNRTEAENFIRRIIELNDGEDEMDLHLSTAETIARARHEFASRAS